MKQELEEAIRAAKFQKAEKLFDHNEAVYGSRENCLKALDCKSRAEAVKMLAAVQSVSIRKVEGVIRVF